MKLLRLLVLPIALFVTACQMDRSEAVKIVCPTIQQYDPALTSQALAEYDALPSKSAIKIIFGDAKQLRDQVRACHAAAGTDPYRNPTPTPSGTPR